MQTGNHQILTLDGTSPGAGVISVTNCIIYDNYYGDTYIRYDSDTNRIWNTCASYNRGPAPNSSQGNIASNPMFANSNAANYRLSAGSPCINRGINESWMTGAVDLDGQHRRIDTFSGQVDMGCYEHLPSGAVFKFR